MTAFRPEPQTLLIVVAPIVGGMPAPMRSLARGRLALAGLHDVAHDTLR